MNTLSNSVAFEQGLSDADNETIPFGACRGTGVPDEIFAGYSRGVVARGLDRLGDDIEAAPAEDYHESGADLDAERRHVNAIIDEISREVPGGTYVRLAAETAYHRHADGARADSRKWTCILILPDRIGGASFAAVNKDDAESAAREALAKFRASPKADAARREAAGEELERMAETDYGGGRAA